MNPDQLGQFVGQLVVSLFLSFMWLCLRRAVPPLRRRVGISRSYGVAVMVALGACALPVAPLALFRLVAGVAVAGLLYLPWKRSLRNECFMADTIISYSSDTVIGRR